MPTATLINYTGIGHPDPLFAARLLAYTKNTRMNLTPEALTAFLGKPEAELLDELEYMAGTIASSWEFCDLTFAITDLSRSTALQMVRTRTASFAHQSQRVTDMRQAKWDVPPTCDANQFNEAVRSSLLDYDAAITNGASLEDARDLLPQCLHGNLIAKYNLRGLVDLVRARDSLRVQGPYADVVKQMKQQTLAVWPWAATFFVPKQERAIKMIEAVALQLQDAPGAMYKGPAGTLAKAADLLKSS